MPFKAAFISHLTLLSTISLAAARRPIKLQEYLKETYPFSCRDLLVSKIITLKEIPLVTTPGAMTEAGYNLRLSPTGRGTQDIASPERSDDMSQSIERATSLGYTSVQSYFSAPDIIRDRAHTDYVAKTRSPRTRESTTKKDFSGEDRGDDMMNQHIPADGSNVEEAIAVRIFLGYFAIYVHLSTLKSIPVSCYSK